MGTIGDITKLLEKIPIWKALKVLPERIEKLEARVDALDKQLSDGVGEMCPSCGKRSCFVILSKPHPQIKARGVALRTMECKECKFTEDVIHTPKV